MRVADLAKELDINSDAILAKLKSLKLKAKDSKQELNDAVVVVLRRELKPAAKPPVTAKTKETPVKEVPKKAKAEIKEKTTKSAKTKETGKTKPVSRKAAAVKAVEPKETKASRVEAPASKAKLPEAAAKTLVKPALPQASAALKEPLKVVPTAPASSAAKRPDIRESSKIAVRQPAVIKPPVAAPKEEYKGPLRELEIELPIAVKDLAFKMQEKASIILKSLLEKGIMATINQNLDEAAVRQITAQFGFNIVKIKTHEEELLYTHKAEEDDPKLLKARAPVVTFMGHVDHGKTSLLDQIRRTKVADQEHGGITQHIGAYSVKLPRGKITFLDTPGHEAFTAMRARGAQITDLVVLVVAADEGVMPQTEEAINHARAANVPIIVALNKIDKKNIDIERVKKELAERGLNPEDWGGKTIIAGVSAHTGEGIDHLLEMILLEAEILELKANYEKRASGIVVEAKLSRGKGPVATVIVQNGTLREGQTIIVGACMGRIKAMLDDHERSIQEAGPATAAEILGLSDVPEAGETFYVVEDEKIAREIVAKRKEHRKAQKMQPTAKITLEDLYSQIQQGKIRELNIIVKADVQGSVEALKDSLDKISNEEVQLRFIHTGVGEITASDVILAAASNAIIIGFNTATGTRAEEELQKQVIDVRHYRIIYDAVNDVKKALSGLLEPKTRKKFLSRIEVRQVFKLSRSGIIAGCFVSKGRVNRKANVDVLRNGAVVFSGTISSVKRFKDDVREVSEGFECGIAINGFDDYQVGDIFEAYELEKIARTL